MPTRAEHLADFTTEADPALYSLVEVLCEEAEEPPTAEPKPPIGPANAKAPCGWADITVGSVVLATEGPGEGWWESLVIGEEAEVFTLKWRDYPDLPRSVRRRWQLALLHPAGRT